MMIGSSDRRRQSIAALVGKTVWSADTRRLIVYLAGHGFAPSDDLRVFRAVAEAGAWRGSPLHKPKGAWGRVAAPFFFRGEDYPDFTHS